MLLTQKILQDITLLKYVGVNPIVVHGGGPDINFMLKKMEIEAKFHEGLRITDAATMEIVPIPQYASSTVSFPVRPAKETAVSYSFSVCTGFT